MSVCIIFYGVILIPLLQVFFFCFCLVDLFSHHLSSTSPSEIMADSHSLAGAGQALVVKKAANKTKYT